ncbi:MAG TPA: DNA translocase FtsK 4TM domain-containing protein, partial [Candidatus Aquilonibacter sp.]
MARVRRKASARTLNLEIVGIAALAVALLCGVALAVPEHAGNAGRALAGGLRQLFGGGAALFPVLVALLGGIVFLEINVPRMIAGLGSAALSYFLLIDTALGSSGHRGGGFTGERIWSTLAGLFGSVGAWIVLVLVTLTLTLSLTQVSLKKLIGLAIGALRRVPVPAMPKIALSLPEGHSSLRDAFALPKGAPASPRKAAAKPDAFDVAVAPVEFDEEPALPPAPVSAPVVGDYEPADLHGAARNYKLPDLALFDAPQAQVV